MAYDWSYGILMGVEEACGVVKDARWGLWDFKGDKMGLMGF